MILQKRDSILFLPVLGILALYLVTQLFAMGPGPEETAAAFLSSAALACFAYGERLAGNPACSLRRSIFWGLLGTAVPFLAAELVLYQDLEILAPLWGEVLLPLLLLLCLAAGSMAFLRRTWKIAGNKKKLWHLWLFLLGAVLLGFTFTDRAWRWDAAYLWFWYPLALLSLPLSLPALYRWLKHVFPASVKGGGFLPTASYFALAALLYGVTTGIVSPMIAEPQRADPMMGVYQIVLCVLVFWSENKADPVASRSAAAAGAALYTAGCVGWTFFSNVRLREILFYLGGPAIRISTTVREDWLGYHWTAAKSFLSGESGLMDAAFAGTPNDSYQLFFYGDNPLFPCAIAILGAMIALTVLELGLLAQRKLTDPCTARCKKYLLVGIAVRMVLASFSMIGMFQSYPVNFPFTGAAVLDFIVFFGQKFPAARPSTGSRPGRRIFSWKKFEPPEKGMRYHDTSQREGGKIQWQRKRYLR